MHTVDDYAKYRTTHRDGTAIRPIARTFHVSRRTVRETLASPEPKPYTRTKPPPAPVLGPVTAIIDRILRDDRDAPPKPRHTAAQLFRRLQDEHGYPGAYPTVQRYVAAHRQRSSPTFLPLGHPPGHRLEADFGPIHVDFPDGRRLVPVRVTVGADSNAPFVIALPTERTEAIRDGLVRAVEFFSAVPREVWWDNPRTVATRILRGRQRPLHPRYATLASHSTFEAKFCLPAPAHEKPDAASGVRAVPRRFATPVPRVADITELNEHMRQRCLDEQRRTVRSASGAFVIGDRSVQVLDPVHSLATLERRPAALDHAPVYRDWEPTAALAGLRRALEGKHGTPGGTRPFIRVLQLLAEHPQSRVERAIEACRAGHALTAEAIVPRTRTLAAAEAGRSPAIDHSLEIANIPLVWVPPPDRSRFNRLRGGDAAAGRPESRAAGGAKPMIET